MHADLEEEVHGVVDRMVVHAGLEEEENGHEGEEVHGVVDRVAGDGALAVGGRAGDGALAVGDCASSNFFLPTALCFYLRHVTRLTYMKMLPRKNEMIQDL